MELERLKEIKNWVNAEERIHSIELTYYRELIEALEDTKERVEIEVAGTGQISLGMIGGYISIDITVDKDGNSTLLNSVLSKCEAKQLAKEILNLIKEG